MWGESLEAVGPEPAKISNEEFLASAKIVFTTST